MLQGILLLAQANFKNTTGVRYGADYYDQRMQATTLVSISDKTPGSLEVSIAAAPSEVVKGSPSISRTSPSEDDGDSKDATAARDSDSPLNARSEQKPRSDPLRWFGILVPPQLRSCQSTFTNLANGPLVKAANASRRMRQIETEIRKLRKEIRKIEKSG